MPHCYSMDDVTATDDANQPALSYHRYALDFALAEEHCNIANGRVFFDGCYVAAHDVGDAQSILVEQSVAVDLADDICFCDDPYQIASCIKYGDATNTKLVE